MKVFVITSRIPYPLDKGDKLRLYYQLKELSKYHTIYLCAIKPLLNVKDLNKSRKILNEFCKEIYFVNRSLFLTLLSLFQSVFNSLPFQTALFTECHAKKRVNLLIDKIKPDYIYCQLTRAADYVYDRKESKILDYMDVFSKNMEQRAHQEPFLKKWFYHWEASKQKNYEKEIFNSFDSHTIISKKDKKYINHPKKNQIYVIPNGVDFNYFKPKNRPFKYDLVFVGNMAYEPNIDASEFLCKEIVPLIQKQIPNIKVLIAGTDPTQRVKNLSSECIDISGWIEDIRIAYAESKVFIAPMRLGTGLQNKLLEAMAMEKACITTNYANNALQASKESILIGNSSEELSNHCIYLLKNENIRKNLAQQALKFVQKKYKWKKATEKLHQLFIK